MPFQATQDGSQLLTFRPVNGIQNVVEQKCHKFYNIFAKQNLNFVQELTRCLGVSQKATAYLYVIG